MTKQAKEILELLKEMNRSDVVVFKLNYLVTKKLKPASGYNYDFDKDLQIALRIYDRLYKEQSELNKKMTINFKSPIVDRGKYAKKTIDESASNEARNRMWSNLDNEINDIQSMSILTYGARSAKYFKDYKEKDKSIKDNEISNLLEIK